MDARALKCETSVGLTEEEVENGEAETELGGDEKAPTVLCARNWFWTECGAPLSRRRRLRRAAGVDDEIVVAMMSGVEGWWCLGNPVSARPGG